MPDNGIAVEPREAQRPTSLAARTPSAAILGNGDIAVGARWTGDSGPPKGGVAHRPGASRRSNAATLSGAAPHSVIRRRLRRRPR